MEEWNGEDGAGAAPVPFSPHPFPHPTPGCVFPCLEREGESPKPHPGSTQSILGGGPHLLWQEGHGKCVPWPSWCPAAATVPVPLPPENRAGPVHATPTGPNPPQRGRVAVTPSVPTGQRTLHHRGDVLETLVLLNPSDKSLCDEVSWECSRGMNPGAVPVSPSVS